MTDIPKTPHRRWLLAMAASTVAFAGATIATASDKTEESREEVHVVKVVRIHDDGEHRDHATKHVHRHEVEIASLDKCDGAAQVDESDEVKNEDGEVRKSRVVICSHGGTDSETLSRLEKARDRLASDDDLSAAARTKALAALDRAIERMRGAK